MSFKNEYILQVDIKKRLASPVPVFKRGDTAVLKFKVFDDGLLYDLADFTRAEVYHTLPSGSSLVGNATLDTSTGLIVYSYTRVEMAEEGAVSTSMTIFSGETQVSIQPFNVYIYDNFNAEELSYIGVLQDLIAEVNILETNVESALADVNQAIGDVQTLETNVTNAEATRESNENTRITNENSRNSAETTRESNETARINAESVRESNETTRENNESTRQSNETTRQTAETNRQTSFDNKIIEVDTAITNANTTTTNLQTLINETDSVGVFNLTTAYQKNNMVLNDGSTWIALMDTQNNPLPILPIEENTWWRLVARKGTDGQGATQSVNNIAPDVNGNITLTASDVGAYVKPSTGIPSTDLDSGVQTSLGKADTALQSVPSATTTQLGLVQLNDTLTSTSTTEALTANQGNELSNQISILSQDVANNYSTKTELQGVNDTLTAHLAETNTNAHMAKNIGVPPLANLDAGTLETILQRLIGTKYHMTSQSNGTAFVITDIQANTTGVWELFLIANPNLNGDVIYKASNVGYVTISGSYDGTKKVFETTYTEVLKVAGAVNNTFNINVTFTNSDTASNSVEIGIASGYMLRVEVSGFLVGYEGADMTLLLRRVV